MFREGFPQRVQKRVALAFYIKGYESATFWGHTYMTLHPIGRIRLMREFLNIYSKEIELCK